jgi:hypothetical protein
MNSRSTSRNTNKRPSTSNSNGTTSNNRPGTATTSKHDSDTSWLLAILEGKGRELGVVAIQSETHQVIITQASSLRAEHELLTQHFQFLRRD